MRETPRWMAPLAAEAALARVRLPWERGLRRAAMIARRARAMPMAPRPPLPGTVEAPARKAS